MIADLKPYSAMKASGVPGLGEVPAHWDMKRAKFFVREVDDRSVSGGEELLSVSHKTGVTPRREKNVTMFLAESNAGHKLCRPGDVIVNTMWAWMAALGVSRHEGLVSPSYGVYRPYRPGAFLLSYLDELLRTPAYRSEYVVRSTGITSSRLRLYPEAFLRIPFLCPPSGEQDTIVRFLGHAGRQIRRYIRGKLKMIELLEGQKQAIIHRAVTRGLDPNIRLKPSGVEWLGEVPEHWEVRRLKTLVSRVTSGPRGWSNFAADRGPLFIRIGNLTRASIGLDLADAVRLNLPDAVAAEAVRARVRPNDLLLSITAFIGSIAVVPDGIGEAYISQHVACCRPKKGEANVKWIAYVLLSSVGQTHGRLCMNGGTKQGLSLDDVKNYLVLMPLAAEQTALVDWIEAATASVDAAIRAARREISLLREYRTRLTADVVTGKLDVRQVAATLPDEADEPEPLDYAGAVETDEAVDDTDSDAVPEEDEA